MEVDGRALRFFSLPPSLSSCPFSRHPRPLQASSATSGIASRRCSRRERRERTHSRPRRGQSREAFDPVRQRLFLFFAFAAFRRPFAQPTNSSVNINSLQLSTRPGFPVPAFLKSGVTDAQARSFADAAAVYVNKALGEKIFFISLFGRNRRQNAERFLDLDSLPLSQPPSPLSKTPQQPPAFAYRLVSGKDILLAGQAALALFALGKVASWFTSLGLVFVAAVLAFSLPKIYELRKGEIDGLAAKAADQGKAHYKKFLEPYVAKIPRASTAVGGASSAAAAPAKKAE